MNTEVIQEDIVRTARHTGLWYLLIAISGMLGFMLLHPQVYIADNPEQTLANLTGKLSMARMRLLLELLIVTSQALAAVWFYRLFRPVKEWAAWAIAAWGMMNAAAIMISAISMGAAISIAQSTMTDAGHKIALVQVLSQLIQHAWSVGGIFFGLWLMPMGFIITSSQCMPVWLGRVLILGGLGYILMTFLGYAGIDSSWLQMLVVPATIGEFWMISYLLVYGIRTSTVSKSDDR